MLHLFTDRLVSPLSAPDIDAIAQHPPPGDSRDVFAPGAVLAVPLRIASGVRMKILEAWARGVPVVASPQAAVGLGDLDELDGDCLLLAGDGDGFTRAIGELRDPERRRRLVEAGRRRLRRHHDPRTVAEVLVTVYGDAIGGGGSGPVCGAESA
jgi:glycosyltransferase involved in cell wall biosynthesis